MSSGSFPTVNRANTNAGTGTAVLRGGSFVAGIAVRVLTGELHCLSATATQYAIENGDSIADHVIRAPNFVDVQFEMTNTTESAQYARWDDEQESMRGHAEAGASRAITVAHEFNRMIDARTPITLQTEHFIYKNMIVVSFTPEHRSPHLGAYRAAIRLQQVGIVGGADSVSAQGGRPKSILLPDGTHLTAVAMVRGGTARPVAEGENLNRLLEIAESKSLA